MWPFNTASSPHTGLWKSALYSDLLGEMTVAFILLFSLFLSHSTERFSWCSGPCPALLTEESCLFPVSKQSESPRLKECLPSLHSSKFQIYLPMTLRGEKQLKPLHTFRLPTFVFLK